MDYEQTKHWIEFLGVSPEVGPTGNGYGIDQNPHELATFLCALPPIKTVLEIGTGPHAGLARLMSEGLGWDVITIDGNPPQIPALAATQVVGNSADVVDRVVGDYDLVIIDAGHHYEAVSGDYARYGGMGKIVMFHDIAGDRGCQDVARFWKEISRTAKGKMKPGYFEVIDKGPMRAGIGWIVK